MGTEARCDLPEGGVASFLPEPESTFRRFAEIWPRSFACAESAARLERVGARSALTPLPRRRRSTTSLARLYHNTRNPSFQIHALTGFWLLASATIDSPTQYHIQTDDGDSRFFKFETWDGQFRKETRAEDGSVVGSYSWVDANGMRRQYDYVADSKGFRIVNTRVRKADGPVSTVTAATARRMRVVKRRRRPDARQDGNAVLDYQTDKAFHREKVLSDGERVGEFGYIDPLGVRRVVTYSSGGQFGDKLNRAKENDFVGEEAVFEAENSNASEEQAH